MAITIDGVNKHINLTTTTSWDFHDIYIAIVDWSFLPENQKYLLPCSGSGKIGIGSSIYTDSIYKLLNGWKLCALGYPESEEISVSGTLVTDDSSSRVNIAVGNEVTWIFQVATQGIITSVGSGLSTEEHNALMGLPPAVNTVKNLTAAGL